MKIKNLLSTFLVITIATFVLINSKTVQISVSKSIEICLSSLVPSLMTFMIVANFVSNSACADVLSAVFGKITCLLFNLPRNCARVVLLSSLGGYPCGAKLIGEMLNKNEIDLPIAQKMLRFCINASPAYVISAIGVGLFGNVKIGVIIFVSHILTAWCIGVIFRGKKPLNYITQNSPRLNTAECFVKSVLDSTTAMICISGFAITFSTILALLDVSGITQFFVSVAEPFVGDEDTSRTLLYLLLDVVAGTKSSLECPPIPALLLCAGAVSFGGLSILAQTKFYLSGYKINYFEVFFFRLVHSVLTAGATYIIISITDTTVATIYTFGTNPQQTTTGYTATALFLVCCAFFMVTVDKNISLLLQRRKRQ